MIDHGQECQFQRPSPDAARFRALTASVLTPKAGGQLRETRKRKGSEPSVDDPLPACCQQFTKTDVEK